jgi:hypothetical protein
VALLQDMDYQNQIRKDARDYISDYCSPQKTVDGVLEFYKKIMEQKI